MVSLLFIRIQTSAIHQIEGNVVFHNPVIMHETLKLISKESLVRKGHFDCRFDLLSPQMAHRIFSMF